MKNIIFYTKLFLLSFFALPVFTHAAVQCPGNVSPELGMSDPACYISQSSGYWQTCTWYGAGPGSYWACDGGVQGTSPSVGTNCFPYLEALYSTCGGYGGCSNRTDFGAGDTYKQWAGSTSYICYYITVDSWSECDTTTGYQFATDITQHSTSGTNCQNLNEETTQSCSACGIASNTPTGEAPTENLCPPSNVASVPTLNTTTNMWEWTCTADDGFTQCDVPNSEPGICSSTYTGHAFESQAEFDAAKASGALCTSGTIANPQGDMNNGWTWDCLHIGTLYTNDDLNCRAPCFDYSLNVDKDQFYWSENDDVEVTVNVEKIGACRDQYSCSITIDDDTADGETHTHTISSDGAINYNIDAVCSYNGDDVERSDVINGNCIARSCTSQGTCQASPQAAASSDICQSSCSSNADCTKGRMIETRP